MAQAALIVTFDPDRAYVTTKLRETVEKVAQLADEDAHVDYIDGKAVVRQDALNIAARLIHERSKLSMIESAGYARGMRELIFELFGADDITGEAGLVYVSQELQVRLRRLAS